MMRKLGMAAVAVAALGCERMPWQQEPAVEVVVFGPEAREEAVQADASVPGLPEAVSEELAPALEPAVAAAPAPVMPVAQGIGLDHDCPGQVDHLSRARELRDRGDLAGALAEYRRAAHHSPSDAAVNEEAAWVARQAGDRATAKRAYEIAAEVTATDTAALLKLARLCLADGEAAAAVAAMDEALRREPESAEAYHLRGRARLQASDFWPAIRDFKKATRLDPANGFAWNNLGYTYLLAGQAEQAVKALEKAAELAPQVAYVHNNLGLAYEALKKTEEARAAYGKALEVRPGYVKAMLNKARVSKLAALDVTASGQSGAAAPEEHGGDFAEGSEVESLPAAE